MKTCKDCIHYDVCAEHLAVIGCEDLHGFNDEQIDCKHFKDKSLILDLPCKVGDTVFNFDEFYKRITEYQVTGIETVVSCKSLRGGLHAFSISSFGKTFFHTRESVEQALKERASDG